MNRLWSLLWCNAILNKTFTVMAGGEQGIQYLITIICSKIVIFPNVLATQNTVTMTLP